MDHITANKAYTDYDMENAINESSMRMRRIRKSNSKRPFPPWVYYIQSTYRKIVETTGSLIERLLPKSIHSVTAKDQELKIGLFVLATSLNFLW